MSILFSFSRASHTLSPELPGMGKTMEVVVHVPVSYLYGSSSGSVGCRDVRREFTIHERNVGRAVPGTFSTLRVHEAFTM